MESIFFRIPLALLLGTLFSLVIFWALWRLISVPIDVQTWREATRIEFTRMRKDTDIATKEQEKPRKQPPPPVPDLPQITFNTASVDSNVAQWNPDLDPHGAMSKLNLSAGSDRDIIPLVRIPPDYPPRAIARGIEGWVLVQFTITGTGAVKDAIVIDSQPKKIFDEAALKAIVRYRYNPKVEGGVPVERVGVRQRIIFELES